MKMKVYITQLLFVIFALSRGKWMMVLWDWAVLYLPAEGGKWVQSLLILG